MHYCRHPTPICAPWGRMHQSSLSVYPRQQSSEHLATVTHPHHTNWPSLWQVNECSLHFNFLQNPSNIYTILMFGTLKACPTVHTSLRGPLLSLFISASQHCPTQSPPSSCQQSANFGEILPSWDWQYKVYILTFYTTWFHTGCRLGFSIQFLGGSSIPGSHQIIITFTALVNRHESTIHFMKI